MVCDQSGALEFSNDLGDFVLGWSFLKDLESYPTQRLAACLRTPSLLLQGKLDQDVSWRRVAALATACRQGVTELELFEDGDHRLLDRKETLWRRMERFLAERGIA